MNKQVGERIRSERTKAGFTQAELADKVGFTSQTISNWESGSREPDIDALVKLSSLFGVSLDYLLSGKVSEVAITLDDMDATKRLNHIIKIDDPELFKKYGYDAPDNLFTRQTRYYRGTSIRELNKSIWLDIIGNRAIKVFGVCCDAFLKNNEKGVWAAFLVYDFIDDFVRMAVDADRPDVLENLGFRVFAIGKKDQKRRDPFGPDQDNHSVIGSRNTYLIATETLDYFFEKRKTSPKCFAYLTAFDFSFVPLKTGQTSTHITFLQDDIVIRAIQNRCFDVIDRALTSYQSELDKLSIEPFNRTYYSDFYDLVDTHILKGNSYCHEPGKPIGRLIGFKKEAIESLLSIGEEQRAKTLLDYNGRVLQKIKDLGYSARWKTDGIFFLDEEEWTRVIRLNHETDETSREWLLCIKRKIIVPEEIKKLRNLSLVQEILNKGFFNYYEFAYESLTHKDVKELFAFLVNEELNEPAEMLLKGEQKYARLLSYFLSERLPFSKFENKLPLSPRGTFLLDGKEYAVSDESEKLTDNKLIAYIKYQKQEIYESVKRSIETEAKEKQDAIDRAKAVQGLTRDYFEDLLSKKGLFAKKERRLFIIDLCSLLDAILKFDHQCEGDDFFARMTNYFKALSDNAPKSKDKDDGWGYSVLDEDYEEQVVIPERKRIEHLSSVFNRLSMQRNNIVHSEANKVEELSDQEMKECLDYVFSISKEGEKHE